MYRLLSPNAASVFCITESKLAPSIDDKEINISGYTLFRSDRTREGGGVAIYCRQQLEPRVVNFRDIKGVKHICIKVTIARARHLLVCCVYQPPSALANWNDAFNCLANSIVSDSTPCVTLGGFNKDL